MAQNEHGAAPRRRRQEKVVITVEFVPAGGPPTPAELAAGEKFMSHLAPLLIARAKVREKKAG